MFYRCTEGRKPHGANVFRLKSFGQGKLDRHGLLRDPDGALPCLFSRQIPCGTCQSRVSDGHDVIGQCGREQPDGFRIVRVERISETARHIKGLQIPFGSIAGGEQCDDAGMDRRFCQLELMYIGL